MKPAEFGSKAEEAKPPGLTPNGRDTSLLTVFGSPRRESFRSYPPLPSSPGGRHPLIDVRFI
ncbi:hypothetical protein N7527_003065 [Penicillium freii]|nr:hypothetical protein N7527_003065 [Penicillium freii]